jgi:hypothetical protein
MYIVSSIYEPIIQFMTMDDYSDHFQLYSLDILSGDTNAWTPFRRN